MSEEETAFKRQPGLRRGCRVHAVSSADGEAAVGGELGVICQHALDPGLALRARVADKSYVNLAKQKSCSFNILMSYYVIAEVI